MNSGICKSKSEPLNLKSVAQNKKSKKQKNTPKNSRPKSKSPRNSTIIPGVRQTHLRLIPTSPLDNSQTTKWAEKKENMTLPVASNHQMAISDIWADESPNVARGPSVEDEVNDRLSSLAITENKSETQNTV